MNQEQTGVMDYVQQLEGRCRDYKEDISILKKKIMILMVVRVVGPCGVCLIGGIGIGGVLVRWLS